MRASSPLRRSARLIPLLAALLWGCQPSEPIDEAVSGKRLTRGPEAPSLNPAFDPSPLPDFAKITDTQAKKAAFFGYLGPLIESENAHIATLRGHLRALSALITRQGALHPEDQRWLDGLAAQHRIDAREPAEQVKLLERKIGTLPPALVMAQAANESAWGTSRFARQGNNLFGQWCFTPGCGIAPLQRSDGATHEVEKFASVAEGIHSYFTNLNGNQSYSELRRIRRCLKANDQKVKARALAAGLSAYSARGDHYVDELRAMIRINKLESWDSPWWGDTDSDHPCFNLVQVEADHPDPILKPAEVAPVTTLALVAETQPGTGAGLPLPPANPVPEEVSAKTLPAEALSTDAVVSGAVLATASAAAPSTAEPIEASNQSEVPAEASKAMGEHPVPSDPT